MRNTNNREILQADALVRSLFKSLAEIAPSGHENPHNMAEFLDLLRFIESSVEQVRLNTIMKWATDACGPLKFIHKFGQRTMVEWSSPLEAFVTLKEEQED